jgi:enoyl-CoA hydratase
MDLVTTELDGDVAVIRIDDGKANALSPPIVEALDQAVHRAANEARAVALIGREGRFSAGFDLKTMQSGLSEARTLLEAGARLALAIFGSPVPVVIGCTGHALAMGGILLFTSDLRIGAEGPYKLGMNEVSIGMPVPRFAVELARHRLTPRHLTEAVQLARIHNPAEALGAGFLDEVVPLDEAPGRAVARAHELAAGLDPTAFRLTRQYLRGPVIERLISALDEDTGSFVVGGH